MHCKAHILSIICLLIACPADPCAADPLDKYLHKNASLGSSPSAEIIKHSSRKPISAKEACSFALSHLQVRGIKKIQICEATWIAAPLSGYLIDAKGVTTIRAKRYSIFRIGIRDGLEEKGGKQKAGQAFVFIARGIDDAGKTLWYPPPGPDYKPGKGETTTDDMLAYEFLLNRNSFEKLAGRYP